MKDQKMQPPVKDPKAMKDTKQREEKEKAKGSPTPGKPATPGSAKR